MIILTKNEFAVGDVITIGGRRYKVEERPLPNRAYKACEGCDLGYEEEMLGFCARIRCSRFDRKDNLNVKFVRI